MWTSLAPLGRVGINEGHEGKREMTSDANLRTSSSDTPSNGSGCFVIAAVAATIMIYAITYVVVQLTH